MHALGIVGRDPRVYQITILSLLLGYGAIALGFDVSAVQIAVSLGTALAVQWLFTHALGLPRFDPRSPLISALSLCLILRTHEPLVAAAAAAVAIGSKFLIRIRGKHVFNPTNVAIVAMLVATDRAWVSPGQWGSAVFVAFLFACLGGLVVNRAARSDVTYAFLVSFSLIVIGRSLWLGDPLAIPIHRLESGTMLLFAFFMISDPKTTPDRRAGRVLFACIAAVTGAVGIFSLHEPNGLLYALVLTAPWGPVIDRLLPGRAYDWTHVRPTSRKETLMSRSFVLSLLGLALTVPLPPAAAFCGFYVAKADTRLFNEASRVVLVRDGDRTVITMANDYRGEPDEFAVVIPVPEVPQRGQIHVTDMALIDHLDAYSAPRLVEYFDDDPCRVVARELPMASLGAMRMSEDAVAEAKALGVTIEATYTVGEYDILILSAEESHGLETWLVSNGYRMPEGAARVLGSYIKQSMRFFVAKVNLDAHAELGYRMLRPLQVAYESPKFMLPIRLGTVNAAGSQELYVFALTRTGRVETTNYRTVKLPSDVEIPAFVKDAFPDFYRAMFDRVVERERMRAVFLEYAWDMAWCDPCAADPLPRDELRELGVFWLDGDAGAPGRPAAQNVYVTRLHLRYDGDHFPDDLFFQETGNRESFQGRYVVRHPWTGTADCERVRAYREELRRRRDREAETLAGLTGWDLETIRAKMALEPEPEIPETPWWQRLWGG